MNTILFLIISILSLSTGRSVRADEITIPKEGTLFLSCTCLTGASQEDQPFEISESYPVSKTSSGHTPLTALFATSWQNAIAIFVYQDGEFTIQQGNKAWEYEITMSKPTYNCEKTYVCENQYASPNCRGF